MADDEYFGRRPRKLTDVAATPWSEGAKRVLMTEQAWLAYHSAWIVCYRHDGCRPDPIDVMHLHRARSIVFG